MLFRSVLSWLGHPKKKSARKRPASRPALEVLEDRWVPATLKVGSGETYSTIQSAVTAAASSGTSNTILIDPGTYAEQVTIPNTITTAHSLVINASNTSNEPTVKPTGTLTGNNAIFDVAGATGVTIENLVIDGSGTSSAYLGVYVEGGGSATIQNNTIQKVMGTFTSGGQNGFGVRVGRSSLSGLPASTGTATVSGNNINNYGKGGVDIANTGSSGTVSGNTVTGLGHRVGDNTALTQNGVEIDDGATGTVSGNTITKNGSSKTGYGSGGVLLYNPGSAAKVSGNTLTNNDVGIWDFGGTGISITGNTATNSTYYGIATDSPDGGTTTVQGATITGNTVSSTVAGAEGFDLYYLTGTNGNLINISGNTASNNAAYGFDIGHLSSTYTSGGTSNTLTLSGNTASSDGSNPTGNWTLATDGTGIAGATGKDGVFISSAALAATGSGTIMTPLQINGNTASSNQGYGFNLQNVTATVTLTGNATLNGPISITGNTAASNQLDGYMFNKFTFTSSGTGTANNNAMIQSNTAGGSSSGQGNKGNGYTFNNITSSSSGSITFTGHAAVMMNNAQYNTGNGFAILNSPGLGLSGGTNSIQSFSSNNGGDGFLVQNSNGASVSYYMAQSNSGNGFDLESSTGLTINNNQAGGSNSTGNKMNGFYFTGVQSSSIASNTSQYNSLNGILLTSNSTGNTISSNTFNNNNTSHTSGDYDANDQTTGSGTGGSANTWHSNTLGTKNKSGLQ